MKKRQPELVTCQICKQQKPLSQVMPAELLGGPMVETIRKQHADWAADGYICLPDLNHFRTEHVQELLEAERGELSELELDVVRSLHEQELLSTDVNAEFHRRLAVGERLADKIAEFGGSWTFIGSFFAVLVAWIVINTALLRARPYDPYPFILLNLILSCLAAIQAPVIMMSQNRQEAKDRLRSEHDYRVNLKAEVEVRTISTKLDRLLTHQWQRLLEIQQIQTEMMEELARHPRR